MFTNPEKNLKAFGIGENMIVADLGAGTGFYSIVAAKMATLGKVYAIEVIKDFLITIRNKAKDEGLKNLECLWGNVEKIGGTGLGDGIIDRAIASNILFQIENKTRFVDEVKRILKPGGKILLVDWSTSLAQKENSLKVNISKEEVLDLFKERGFTFEREIDAGISHYGLIFKK